MKWHQLTELPSNLKRWIWVSDGIEVWITKPLSSYWNCQDKDKLRWAEIEWPQPPRIE